MSTLVAYDSSSEEDEPNVAQYKSEAPQDTRGAEQDSQVQPESAPQINDAPFVGPSIPLDIGQDYEDYEYEKPGEDPTSERDMIRHLTQASHPMTEMPPSPPGSPNPTASTRFKHFLDLKAKGVHFNEDLARKSAFKNPALLKTLMDRAGLEVEAAFRSSLPSDVFGPAMFPASSYKEELLKSQQVIRAKEETEKKALSMTGKRTMEFTSGGISAPSSVASSPGGLHKRQKQ